MDHSMVDHGVLHGKKVHGMAQDVTHDVHNVRIYLTVHSMRWAIMTPHLPWCTPWHGPRWHPWIIPLVFRSMGHAMVYATVIMLPRHVQWTLVVYLHSKPHGVTHAIFI